MNNALNTLLDPFLKMPEEEQNEHYLAALEVLGHPCWIPNPGPQTEAYYCLADILLYGGQGGGGKTDLLGGTALTAHDRSLLMRPQYTDLGALIDRVTKIAGTIKGLNKSPPPQFKHKGRLIDFGAATNLEKAETWQGNPHDLIGFDEACQFMEAVVRFIMGWNRIADEDLGAPTEQRCRTILASNPPLGTQGNWIIGMFRPWLDLTHPEYGKVGHGELRWAITDPDGNDLWVDGPDDIRTFTNEDGDIIDYRPMSRTFIPAKLEDNPFLINTNYRATLDAMQEPMRSAIRDGNFMAARQDAVNQAIPTMWVIEAQKRWKDRPPPGIPMCAISVDPSGGGEDPMIISTRYDGWFAPFLEFPAKTIPKDSIGRFTAGQIVANRRNEASVIIDMGGGYGGSTFEALRENQIDPIPHKGAEKSPHRTADRQLGFFNKRSQVIWQFREALDPNQDGGSPIALPPDQQMLADLTTPTFKLGPRGIQVQTKEEVVAILGRSTDKGDSVVNCWSGGERHLYDGHFVRTHNRKPTVITKRSKRDMDIKRARK